MHQDTHLLVTIICAFAAAFAGGVVARAIKLPSIIGYLVGGLLIGPFTPGFVGDASAMSQLSELGVMFLMFGVGLHFSLDDLLAVKNIALPGALLQMLITTLASVGLAHMLGWSMASGIVLGLSLSIASTVVLIRNLADADLTDTKGGSIATGWLIVEDLITVVVLVVLPVVFGPAASPTPALLLQQVLLALVKTIAFVALMLIVGSRVLPWALLRIANLGSRELFQLCVVVLALGTALLASAVFDLSVALGAFLAGVVASGSRLSHRVAQEAIPFQDLFSILFFASVGMLVDPATLLAHIPELAALVGLIVVGKFVLTIALGAVLGADKLAVPVIAAGLAQIGEFSFLVGQLALSLGVLSANQYTLILGASVISIALNPALFLAVSRWIMHVSPASDASPANKSHLMEVPCKDCEPVFTAALDPVALQTDLVWVQVAPGSAADGASLVELDLRARTGAQAIAHKRGDTLEPDLGIHAHLRAGDSVGLVGTTDALVSARELFGQSQVS